MKKILASLLVLISLFVVGGCSNKNQDEFTKYMYEDMQVVNVILLDTMKSYATITDSSVVNDKELFSQRKQEIDQKFNNLISKAKEIKPKESKLKEAHDLYIKAFTKQKEAFLLVVDGIENNNTNKINEANKVANEIKSLTEQYTKAINDLKNEYDVVTK